MVLPIETAVRSLEESVEDHGDAAGKISRRLSEVRTLLEADLAWVEKALAEATSRGEQPGCDAARHLVSRGGKRVRPMSVILAAACFGSVSPAVREMALVSELIHTATLLHDDVIDDGKERRGAATARMIWGNAVSVLAGDLLLVNALERTGRSAPEILASLFTTLRELVDGEIVQLRGRAELDVSRGTYDRILQGKTASLFRWATGTGARLGGASTTDQGNLETFGELVGMAFQLVDDVLDYTSDGADKTPLADLRDGKMTLPLVLALESNPDLLHPVRRIHRGDDTPLGEVCARVIESGACEEVRRIAHGHTVKALEVLHRVPRSAPRTMLESIVADLDLRNR